MVDRTSTYFPFSPRMQLVRDTRVADFNGDRKPDIFFSNHGTEVRTPHPGEQNRLFLSTPSAAYKDATANLPRATDFSHGSAVGDVDGDRDVDIWVNNLGDDQPHFSSLLLNNGAGSFTRVADWSRPGTFLPPDTPHVQGCYWSHIFDMDSDGDVDLYCDAFFAGGRRTY